MKLRGIHTNVVPKTFSLSDVGYYNQILQYFLFYHTKKCYHEVGSNFNFIVIHFQTYSKYIHSYLSWRILFFQVLMSFSHSYSSKRSLAEHDVKIKTP